jgi:FixJ family two-component response regulator
VAAIHFGNILKSTQQIIVAVVDDDRGMRTAMERCLSVLGYGTEIFDSAAAFLKAVATSEATCLVVDFHLGDSTGVELAHQLAADGFKYPIIFMSGHDNENIRTQVTVAGGVAFLRKPFPAELLQEAIIKAIGQSYRR